MSAKKEMTQHLLNNGWTLLRSDGTAFYQWAGPIRIELHLVYDTVGRLKAWSQWENIRTRIDQNPGLRNRLLEATT